MLFLCCLLAGISTILYEGIGFSVDRLVGNFFINLGLSTIIDLIGNLFYDRFCDHSLLGRKKSMVGFCIILTISAATLLLLSDQNEKTKITVFLITKFCSSIIFAINFEWANEIFPTAIRSKCLGYTSASAYVLALVYPFILGVGKTFDWVPFFCFACLSGFGAVISCFLPETLGKEPVHTMEQAEKLYLNQK